MEKIRSLISEQFTVEIDRKEKENELIDSRIKDVESMLQRLRGTLLHQYYGLTDVDPATRSDLVKATEMKFTLDSQEEPSATSGSHTIGPDRSSERSSVNSEDGNGRHGAAASLSSGDAAAGRTSQVSSRDFSDSTSPAQSLVRKRIIVGNTSRFIPEDHREVNDQSTHKWMVYVRGSKEEPEVDHFISKVVFFLHSSYKPNDVVEVKQAPFHLTRRGWGEFPIRVRLFLHGNRYKPVDIVHPLQLDRTYTGLQALGAETLVNLQLDPHVFQLHPQSIQSGLAKSLVGAQSVHPATSTSTSSNKPPVSQLLSNGCPTKELSVSAARCVRLEHSYSRSMSAGNAATLALEEARAFKESTCHTLTLMKPADFAARIGERLAAVNASGGTVSLEQALVEGVRLFPLISSTQDKCIHPYVARSTGEFQSWSIGKQRAAEWLRALALRRQIQNRVLLPSSHKLTTRYVFTWCRLQGHSRVILMGQSSPQSGVPRSPLALCGLCSRLLGNSKHDVHISCRRQCLNNGLTLSSCEPVLKDLALQQASIGYHQRKKVPNKAVDVVAGGPIRRKPFRFPTSFGRGKKKAVPHASLFPRYWVREVLSSVRLADSVKPPLDPKEGSVMVPYPAEVALNAACQCMLRDLLTSACELAGSDSSSFNSGISPTLTVFHIHAALSRLPHLDILTDSGLASLHS